MRWRIPLVVALALFVAVSCDQQPVEPPQEAAVTTPTFNFANGPSERGPFIVVYADQWLGGWIAFGEEYWAYAYGYDGDCGFDADWEYVAIKEFARFYEDAPPLIMQTWEGDVNLLIGTGDVSCANVIAHGTGHFVNTDNDVLAFLEGRTGNRVNVYGWKVNGKVTMVADGSKAQARARFREVWTGWPDYEFINYHEWVTLH